MQVKQHKLKHINWFSSLS